MPLGTASDWQPLVAAVAAFVALQGPAVANLLVTLANKRKLEQVHQNTNGSLSSLTAEVAALRRIVEAQQAELSKLRTPPGAV